MLALRNLIYYWRGNVAVLLGVAVGAAVLAGALFVGDSLRGSLADRATRQANGVTAAYTGVRLLDDRVAAEIGESVAPVLMLRGTATIADQPSGTARATVIGLDAKGLAKFNLPAIPDWNGNIAIASPRLAEKLGAKEGDRIRLAVPSLSTIPRSSLLGRRNIDDLTTAITFTLKVVLGESSSASDFSLIPNPEAPLNLFVPLEYLQARLGKPHRVNALFAFGGEAKSLNEKLAAVLEPGDWGLKVNVPPARKAYVSVESEQLVLPPSVVTAVEKAAKESLLRSERTTVYLANWIAANEKQRIPYSIVAALNANAAAPLGPFLPPGAKELRDDEIVLADWPESPLANVPIGSTITLTYFQPDVESVVMEKSTPFRLMGRIPLEGAAFDADLTPPFPGITDKLSIGDWNPPFPFESTRIKAGDANEKYWTRYKTTPKAYISRAAGEKLFASRFGTVTSIRVASGEGISPTQTAEKLRTALQHSIDPAALGIRFDDTRERLAQASVGGTDFGGLFLGFSLFLIVAALVLVGLLVRLSVERRAKDIGNLLALGFTPRRIRRMLLLEGFIVSIFGTIIGLALAVLYARGLIRVLTDLWPDGSVKAILKPHMTAESAIIGAAATIFMAMLAIWFAVRGLVKLPIPGLLRGSTEVAEVAAKTRKRRGLMLGIIIGSTLAGLAALLAGIPQSNPDLRAMSFFSGGGLLFLAAILLVRRWLSGVHSQLTSQSSLIAFGARNAGRFVGRSTLTVLLLGSATFLLVAVESFRRRPDADFSAKTSGSGGFNLIVETDIPIMNSFDREPGKGDFLDLLMKEHQSSEFPQVTVEMRSDMAKYLDWLKVISLRRHQGDDASCLNLYQAGQPRIIGVPNTLIDRGGFKFSESEAVTEEEKANPWLLLTKVREDGAIPVIGEQNSVMWMLKKAIGDEIELPDESGAMKRFRIVATLQDSVFQSELLTSDAAFQKLYPHDEGYSEFLIEKPPIGFSYPAMLEEALRTHGVIVSYPDERVAAYQAIVGTYLTTFQLLGGLGLLLGVLGLAAIVLRGVWERLGEFALLKAVGYSSKNVRTLVLAENLLLLLLGLGVGTITAAIGVLPQGGELIRQVPRLAIMLGIVTAVGVAVVWLATRSALRVPILKALRSE